MVSKYISRTKTQGQPFSKSNNFLFRVFRFIIYKMDVDIVDIQNICRICLNHNKILNSLFDTAIKDKRLYQKLFECASINVTEDDELPRSICEECKKQLIAAFQFRLLCQNSDTKLRQYFLNRIDLQNQCETELYFVDEKLKLDTYSLNTSHTTADEYKDLPLKFEESATKNNYFVGDFDLENSNTDIDNNLAPKYEFTIETSAAIETSNKNTDVGSNELSVSSSQSINNAILEVSEIQSESQSAPTCTITERPINKKKQCQICGKMTTGLKLHVLSHMGIKDFKCEYCGKAFVQRIQYQRHLNIHTGNKPFVCTICGKAFADSTSLRCHNITHTKEKKYKCDTCNKSFGYSHTLTAHKRTHTQDRKHVCEVCDRPFLTKHGLKKHTRTHTGEKPYKCDFCDKRFTTTGNIQTHRRVHTRERPYKCQICGLSFSYKSVLNTHGKIHNK